VYVHLMPWFENKASSGDGKWGQHWTMANKNPDIVDASGKRQIAAHYYPLTGPYASSDPNIIEYQLLLMKLSGIDGVLIDWPGTTQLYDYPANKANSDAIVRRLAKAGLSFAVIYEDQNINIAAAKGVVTDKIGQAKADMTYLKNNYFSQSSYINVNGKPLFGVFGPQTFQSPAEWQQIFADLPTKPCFITLWDKHAAAGGTDCTGEFSWVVGAHLDPLKNFYDYRQDYGVKMGSAYPGFHDFYAEGGWGSGYFYIPAGGTATWNDTLSLALSSGVKYLQLVTWNDYGEGTIIEPTREFGYDMLTTLQTKLGVPYRQPELELVKTLYDQRLQYGGNAAQQTRLDRAAAQLAALQIDAARTTLNTP
jgi:Glycosyl hydrolase family 99